MLNKEFNSYQLVKLQPKVIQFLYSTLAMSSPVLINVHCQKVHMSLEDLLAGS